MLNNWNENNLKHLTSNNWRASLVPAAAVIPAPIVYYKVVAVKKLVVEFLTLRCWSIESFSSFGIVDLMLYRFFSWSSMQSSFFLPLLVEEILRCIFYFEEIRVFKAGIFAMNITAWNNKIRLWSYFYWFKD